VTPFIDLQPVSALVRERVLPRWQASLQRCEFVGGEPVRALETALGDALGVDHVVACASGSSALLLALQAAGVAPGDHVALPNLTFWATFEAVAQLGAVPVLIDIDPQDLQLDVDELARAFERFRFRYVVLVHLFGWASARLTELRRFCREREVTLIEDGAQSFGVAVADVPVLRDAELATLSFYPAKVLGGCMDGGAVVASSPAHADRVRSLANHGRAAHYAYDHIGWNSRMSATAAHYLLEMLGHAEHILQDRRRSAARYRSAAAGWRRARAFGPPSGVTDNGYLCVLECLELPGADAAVGFSSRAIATARTYPSTMDQQRPAAGRFVACSELSRSRAFVRSVLNLPLYYGLPATQQDLVLQAAVELLG
jgi:UDP-2-acetamido-2-deoxy-ribo-hexuluronate aminotransferase